MNIKNLLISISLSVIPLTSLANTYTPGQITVTGQYTHFPSYYYGDTKVQDEICFKVDAKWKSYLPTKNRGRDGFCFSNHLSAKKIFKTSNATKNLCYTGRAQVTITNYDSEEDMINKFPDMAKIVSAKNVTAARKIKCN